MYEGTCRHGRHNHMTDKSGKKNEPQVSRKNGVKVGSTTDSPVLAGQYAVELLRSKGKSVLAATCLLEIAWALPWP